MKIYTKTGDKGETALLGGTRVSKADLRLNAYGAIDELNSFIGMLRSYPVDKKLAEIIIGIQKNLFKMGAYLASEEESSVPGYLLINNSDIAILEKQIDRMEKDLKPLRHFILPGGHPMVSFCHMARTVCRRSERLTVELSEKTKVNLAVVQYLNRLSDYLFVLSRFLEQKYEVEEIEWNPKLD